MDMNIALDLLAAPETERLAATSRPGGGVLLSVLDEIDYGVLLLAAEGELLFANDAAVSSLVDGHCLVTRQGIVRPASPDDALRWRAMLARATRGARTLDRFGRAPHTLSVAATPIDLLVDTTRASLMIVLGRRVSCERISLDAYARMHHITAAEQRVLEGIVSDLKPADIARINKVSVSTVRTQIGQVLRKTGCGSMRGLIAEVSKLPPLRLALRSTTNLAGSARRA